MQSNADGNIHVAEERGQVLLRDNEDEEIQYSGVIRKTVKLNNPKTFKCAHKALAKIDLAPSSEQGLINEKGWETLAMKYAFEEKKAAAQAKPSTSVTGFYQGGGSS